ncbi:MAG: hypothetical protein ACLFTK_03925 [Anaerolineales bacterium]
MLRMSYLKWTSMLLLLLGIALAGAPALAQPAIDDWRMLLYDYDAHQLIEVNATTVTTQPLPYPQPQESWFATAVSPSGRWVVAQTDSQTTIIADLQGGNCCTPVPNPSAASGPVEWTFSAIFNPEETQVALSFVDWSSQTGPLVGGTIVVDLATGQETAFLSSERGGDGASTFGLLDWTPNGIDLYASCWACEGPISGQASRWQPTTNNLAISRYFNLGFSDRLNTGELVIAQHDTRFPLGLTMGMFPPANVINYFQSPENAEPENGRTIYFNPNNLDLPTPRWVINGQGILLHNAFGETPDPGVVLLRDGTEIQANIGLTEQVIGGTPDGWITQDESGTLRHYIFADGTLSITTQTLGQFSPNMRVMHSPALDAAGLPPFTPNIAAPPPPQCEDFMPSRLRPNMTAQVTPGPANNFRDGPSLNANSIGRLPGEAVFFVLDGPVCADGMAWWQVDYQGTVGWTSEGQGNTYWLQPLE